MASLLNPAALYKQALAAARAGDLAEAQRVLKGLLRAQPTHTDAWMLLAQVTGDDQPELRLRYAERALASDPDSQRAQALVERFRQDPALRLSQMTPENWLATIHEASQGDHARALELALQAVERFPEDQRLLLALATCYRRQGLYHEVILTWERCAALNPGSSEGKQADALLANAPAVVTDAERGSALLAWREALGVGLLLLLLAWQDAGLDLLQLGPRRWAGVGLGLLGGYLLVTATGAPQQGLLSRLLGQRLVTPRVFTTMRRGQSIQSPTSLPIIYPEFRALLFVGGAVMLLAAFTLVFSSALGLLTQPVAPTHPYREELIRELTEYLYANQRLR